MDNIIENPNGQNILDDFNLNHYDSDDYEQPYPFTKDNESENNLFNKAENKHKNTEDETQEKTNISRNNENKIQKIEKNNIKTGNGIPKLYKNESKNEIIKDNKSLKKVIKPIIGKIFVIMEIKKKNLKRGRMTQNLKNNYSAEHTRNSEDNIIRKIIRKIINRVLNYINKTYEIYLETQKIKIKKLIKAISPEEYIKFNNKDTLKFLNTKLKDIFCGNLSGRFQLDTPDYNKNQIYKLYNENKAIDVIKILEMTFIEIYQKYINNEEILGFRNLKYDLLIQKKKMIIKGDEQQEIDEYLKLYENTAKNLEKILRGKKSRIRNKKKQ